MKELCLITPAFAFPVGERDFYYPHAELARILSEHGIKTTIICLGENLDHKDGETAVHAVAVTADESSPAMLTSWMPSNSYYWSVARLYGLNILMYPSSASLIYWIFLHFYP